MLASVDPPPVVGDWVVVDDDTDAAASPRPHSLLRRRTADGDGEQALVANLDVVLIVCGLDRPVRLGRIQRSMTLAETPAPSRWWCSPRPTPSAPRSRPWPR